MSEPTIQQYGRAVQLDREAESLGFTISWADETSWRAYKGDRETLLADSSVSPGPKAVSYGKTLDSLRTFLDGVAAAMEGEEEDE